MKLSHTAILERFGKLAGLPPREALRHQYLCRDAAVQLEGILRANVPEEAAELLCAAAAALAFYRLMLIENALEPERFSAGELQVQKDGQSFEKAQKIWAEYQKLAAPYLLDREFVFQGIGG